MSKERDEALDRLAAGTRTLGEGLGTEMKDDLGKAKGGQPPKRPWWKIWARR